MSKSLLIVDTPHDCWDCQLVNEYGYCRALGVAEKQYGVNIKEYKHTRYEGCPLKQVHALKSAGHDYIIYERRYLYDNLDREIELLKKAKEYDDIVREELEKRMEHPERYAKR